jgi:hypothetical protein
VLQKLYQISDEDIKQEALEALFELSPEQSTLHATRTEPNANPNAIFSRQPKVRTRSVRVSAVK